ncbi:MAG: WecB/TagA/CpsF family glycosyl transferase, N-acetylglucosaminyldiphosphoundecaprenol [Candidatus Peregrinibacteria bacterium GW2011_GWF2_39_17]|nr:MAG: WecB/TagA/CpsF family glycosyl transferase, N-acetylglucosaminyldiphosphoundecaprenol [Candidatus Peregrinibacteria bacterium GW2011_GWF2_39_17]HCW32311.1 hypothetical protein [Candidatus Peregrinibacteria bacterium]
MTIKLYRMHSKTAMQLRKHVRDFYNSVAPEFDCSRQRLWADFDFFTPYLKQNGQILDIGCGNGRLLNYFFTIFPKQQFNKKMTYLGIDNSKKILNLAKKQHSGLNINFKEGDILNLNFNKRSSKMIFSIALLHHLPSRQLQLTALQNLQNNLDKDGYLYLSVWNLFQWRYVPYFIKAVLKSILTFNDYSWQDLKIPWGKKNKKWRYCYAFRYLELHKLLEKAGFEIMASQTTKGNYLIIARPFLASRGTTILGVDIDGITLDEAVKIVHNLHNSASQHYVVTPNPEIILKAAKSPSYRIILNNASLKIPDGIGIIWAASLVKIKLRFLRLIKGILGFFFLLITSERLHSALPERVTGVDLMEKIIHQSYPWKAKIFLLGAAPGVAEKVAQKWRLDKIVGTFSGSPHVRDEKKIIQLINKSGATLLFVAFGAPKQEEWIARNLKKMPLIKVAFGVGGAFDFVAGISQRAPLWIQKLGLEWAWRLSQEPRRIKRIWNATIKFPLKIIFTSDNIHKI